MISAIRQYVLNPIWSVISAPASLISRLANRIFSCFRTQPTAQVTPLSDRVTPGAPSKPPHVKAFEEGISTWTDSEFFAWIDANIDGLSDEDVRKLFGLSMRNLRPAFAEQFALKRPAALQVGDGHLMRTHLILLVGINYPVEGFKNEKFRQTLEYIILKQENMQLTQADLRICFKAARDKKDEVFHSRLIKALEKRIAFKDAVAAQWTAATPNAHASGLPNPNPIIVFADEGERLWGQEVSSGLEFDDTAYDGTIVEGRRITESSPEQTAAFERLHR
jgi:hypothetical protein